VSLGVAAGMFGTAPSSLLEVEMQLFKLHIGSREETVRSTVPRLREAMFAYIREQREKGVPLQDIIFCWSPIRVTRTI